MNQENQPHHLSTYSKGANVDVDPELAFSQPATGVYYDGRNCRPVSIDGNTGGLEKIKGEVIIHSNTTSAIGYKCIGARAVNDSKVEFWVPINPAFPRIVRINGVIVLQSINFDLRTDYPLQIDVNEDFDKGEIFITDNRIPPFIFNIKDMLDSLISDPNKYFSNFDPLLYQINLQSPLDIPVFIENVNVGGGGGLPVGHYQYQIRYSSKEGDRTGWSQATPMIPITQSLSSESRIYPWVKTYGGPPNPSSVTAFAPKLRFRVTNIYNYDYIEIKRISYNAGAGLDFTPNGVIVAKIEISPNEISVREYVDPQESNTNIALSAEDESRTLVEVESAKSIRYVDRRLVLMNVKLASKEAELQFKEINGKQGFPVIDKLYKAGYNDPWNHTYKKSAMSGEVYGLGVAVYDGVGTKGFTTEIPQLKNYQFPNRRDAISSETNDYSLRGTVKAADSTVAAVTQTHEVFDLGDPTFKSNECDFKNIVHPGRIAGITGTRGEPKVTEDCDETNAEIENHGADVTAALVSVSYQPYTPVRQNDPDVSGHNYVTTIKVAKGDVVGDPITGAPIPSTDAYNFRPTGFSPDYYAKGLVVAGIQNFPKWAKAFSIVRTNAAKRVLCQGLGYYALTKGKFKTLTDQSLGGKEQNKFWFFSPDIETGIVSSETVNDIIDNPQNYKLQFVSPLGFFSEFFAAEDNIAVPGRDRDRCIDMISYARMLRDLAADPNNQINPSEDANMGISGGDGYNYIRHDKFRNLGQDPLTFGAHSDKGNRLVDIAQVRRVADGRGTYIEIETNINVYGKASVGGNSESNFEDSGLQDWTEPLYIINIVRVGAQINDQNIQQYKQTSHYQKLESIIGRTTGLAGEKFQLVDERWEDSIPAPRSTDFGANVDRYIYIKKPDGVVQKWINVTYKTLTQRATILSDITSLGSYNGDVYGMYTHTNIDNLDRFFELQFDVPGSVPPANSLVIIKYDDTAPIRVFGFDTYVGETIFAPIDKQSAAKDKAAETQFALGIGLPFKNFKINSRHYTIRKAGAAVNAIQDEVWFKLGFLRQLCVMFTVESRSACHLAYNSSYPNQFFPLINYVMRPNRWDIDKTIVNNGLYQDYEDDYGADEKNQWKWGGFRFLQQINPDYSTEPRIEFFSKPKFGFIEKTEFRTRIMWSLARAINVQDSPGLKTFPANNAFDIDDDQGEIKYAWDATSERGENIYALTEKGICLLLTKKSILSDLNSGEIGYMASDSFVKAQLWITKDTGISDEMWRGVAEGFVPVSEGDDSSARQEAIFFPNKDSVFMFNGSFCRDIGRLDYYNKIYNEGLTKVQPGIQTEMAAVYDRRYQEYWLYIGGDADKLFVFGKQTMAFYGEYDYRFDRIYSQGNDTYGVKDLHTFKLHEGYTINNSPIIFEVTQGAAPEQFWGKEFIRMRINSPKTQKPTRIEFYKKDLNTLQCFVDNTLGTMYLKYYDGWEAFIPRILGSVDINRPRLQDRLIFYKIIHNLASEFTLTNTSIQYKKLK